MTDLPVYVWVLVLIGVTGMPLATAFVIKGRRGAILAIVWLAWVAVAAVLRPFIPLAVAGGLIAALLILWRAPVPPERLALPQMFRVVGGAFLIAMALGKLPAAFALPAGLGDILVSTAKPFAKRRAALLWFNALGILDLVVALSLGALLIPSTVALTQMPLTLIPTTAVPLALALHVIAIRRLLA